MSKIPARQFVEKLTEKVNARTDIIKNFVQQLSDEGKLTRTKIKNRWHFDDDDLYKASDAWLFSNQFISSIENELNALPNNSWEKIRLLLQEISKFDFMPICFAYERERKIPTINKENHDLAEFLLDLIDRLERHLLEGSSDTCLQFRPPYRYQGFCHAFGILTAHLGGCYTTTHDLNKFCYTQNALAEFINGRFTSKAVDFDIFLRHFGLNVDDFILPINEDKDKFFDDRPPVVPNTVSSVPAPVQASFVTSHGSDTVGKKISLQTLTQATTNLKTMENNNMKNNQTQHTLLNFGEYFSFTQFAKDVSQKQDGAEDVLTTITRKLFDTDAAPLIQQLVADNAKSGKIICNFLTQFNARVIAGGIWQKVSSDGVDPLKLVPADDCTADPPHKRLSAEDLKPKSAPMPKDTSIHDVGTYTYDDAGDNIETAAQIVGTEEQPPKNSKAKSSAKKSKPKNDATKSSAKKPKPKDKPTVADSSTPTEKSAPTSNNILRTRDYIADCPANLNVPNDFSFSDKGIFHVIPSKKDDGKKRYVCISRTPIIPTRKFRDPVKGTVEYEIAILSDGVWTKTEIEGKTVADPRAIITLNDKGALILDPKLTCRFLSDVIADNPSLPKTKSFNQTGWDEDCENFAFPTADSDSVIRRAGYNYEKIFKPKGNADSWKKKFAEVTEQGGAIARSVIGGAAAAPLVRLLSLPNIQIHVHGKKSSGKTPLLKFAASIFGNPSFGDFSMTFNSTAKARIEAAEAFCDLPLFIDEIESLSKFDADHLSEEVYNYSNHVGRVGLTKNSTRRETCKIYGARLTTGEHAVSKANDNGGALKRVNNLRIVNPFDEDFAADLHGFCERNHGLFAAQWLHYIKEQRDQIAKEFHKALEIAKSRNVDVDDTQLKTTLVSLIAYQHFKTCIGLQSFGNNQEIGADADAIICTLPTTAEMDDATRALNFLRDFIIGHVKYFWRTLKIDGRWKDYRYTTNEGYGKIFRNGEVAFLENALVSILEKEGGFRSGEKIISEWRDKGYIRDTPGRKGYVAKIDGEPTPTICISCELISETLKSSSLSTDELSTTA